MKNIDILSYFDYSNENNKKKKGCIHPKCLTSIADPSGDKQIGREHREDVDSGYAKAGNSGRT